MTPLRITKEQQRKSIALAELKVLINDYQMEHNLTTLEIVSALAGWIELAMKYKIREERGVPIQ